MTIIEKIVPPSNRSNQEEYKAIWIADLEEGKQVWIQMSEDKETPKWMRLGEVYEQWVLDDPGSHMLSQDINTITL